MQIGEWINLVEQQCFDAFQSELEKIIMEDQLVTIINSKSNILHFWL